MSDQESSPEDPDDADDVADTIPSGEGGAELSPSTLGPAVVALVGRVETVEDRLGDLDARLDKLGKEKKAATAEPAEWVWFPVPALSSHPPATAALWVEFYNATYVTTTSSTGDDRNRAIPGCWLQHAGLAAEIATLAAAWRSAFLGPTADPIAAQNWHDRWRPGFADRLRGWAPCTSDRHFTNPEASPPREHRFTDDEAPPTSSSGEAN